MENLFMFLLSCQLDQKNPNKIEFRSKIQEPKKNEFQEANQILKLELPDEELSLEIGWLEKASLLSCELILLEFELGFFWKLAASIEGEDENLDVEALEIED